MTELEQACLLFSKAAVHSRRAAKALVRIPLIVHFPASYSSSHLQSILTTLGEKARVALASAQRDPPTDIGHQGSMWNVKQEDIEDELTIFSGRTRFVSSKQGSPSPAPFSPQSMGPSTPPYPLPRIDMNALSATPSYYSDTPHSSTSSMGNWTPESRRDGYHGSQAEQFIPSQERRISQQYHPSPQYAPPEQIQLPSTPNYQWQNTSGYYGSQGSQQYNHSPTADGYQSQGQLFAPTFHASNQPRRSAELADLGLAARDSRLDERWSSFMHDSGLLDGGNASNYAGNNTGH